MKNNNSVNKPTRTRKSKSRKGNTRITKRKPKRISKPKPLQKKRRQQQQQYLSKDQVVARKNLIQIVRRKQWVHQVFLF
jgi:hypothetical protein